jgi:hypothetical protein
VGAAALLPPEEPIKRLWAFPNNPAAGPRWVHKGNGYYLMLGTEEMVNAHIYGAATLKPPPVYRRAEFRTDEGFMPRVVWWKKEPPGNPAAWKYVVPDYRP